MSDPLPSTRRVLQGEVVDTRPPTAPPLLQWLELASFVMDRLFVLPGTQKRIGLNSLMLLVPILGDLLPTLISFGILAVGLTHYRIPRIVAVRMVLYSLLDASLSWIPVLGNLWDAWFKADTRNVALLRAYAGGGDEPVSTWRHWLFVAGLLLLLAVIFVGLITVAVLVLDWLVRMVRGG